MDTEVRSKQIIGVIEQLARELNPHQEPRVGPSTHLEWDLGLASIERHELLVRLEKELEGSLPSQAVFQAATVAELLALTPGADTEALRPSASGSRSRSVGGSRVPGPISAEQSDSPFS